MIENDPLQLTLFERGLVDLGLVVTSSVGFGKGVATELVALQHQVALLDFDLGPGPNGIDVARFVRSNSPETKMVLITSFTDLYIGEATVTGLFLDVINKREIQNLEKFKALIAPVIRGSGPSRHGPRSEMPLSKTNLRVWHLLALGLTNTEIAEEMDLSVKSIEKSISQLAVAFRIGSQSGNLRVNLVRKFVERNGQLPSR